MTDVRTFIADLAEHHSPFDHPFFRLPNKPTPEQLGQLYNIYQSVMHATRAGVRYVPWMDSVSQRIIIADVILDDDRGDAHQFQLARAFENLGAVGMWESVAFGSSSPDTDYGLLELAIDIRDHYSETLGPWVIIEVLSKQWMIALRDALAQHFPDVVNADYFCELSDKTHYEDAHADIALREAEAVLSRYPDLESETREGAKSMARCLDRCWDLMAGVME